MQQFGSNQLNMQMNQRTSDSTSRSLGFDAMGKPW
jgi:hypothetical protein